MIDDHNQFSGLASLLQQLNLKASISNFAWPMDYVGHWGDDADVLNAYGLSVEQSTAKLLTLLNR